MKTRLYLFLVGVLLLLELILLPRLLHHGVPSLGLVQLVLQGRQLTLLVGVRRRLYKYTRCGNCQICVYKYTLCGSRLYKYTRCGNCLICGKKHPSSIYSWQKMYKKGNHHKTVSTVKQKPQDTKCYAVENINIKIEMVVRAS